MGIDPHWMVWIGLARRPDLDLRGRIRPGLAWGGWYASARGDGVVIPLVAGDGKEPA